ncbi:MAG TPA: hypothetical protein VMZ53_10310, partial [Kofleriaceae bacterium]|nr:hypothetical protein [Kofleriaceae bacterium]
SSMTSIVGGAGAGPGRLGGETLFIATQQRPYRIFRFGNTAALQYVPIVLTSWRTMGSMGNIELLAMDRSKSSVAAAHIGID